VAGGEGEGEGVIWFHVGKCPFGVVVKFWRLEIW